jgi:hypothetical protein
LVRGAEDRHAGRDDSHWSRSSRSATWPSDRRGRTILLGIWLAFALDGYAIWDGWIIAAIVLWAIAGEIGQRTGAAYMQGMTKAKELDAAGQSVRTQSCSRSTGHPPAS